MECSESISDIIWTVVTAIFVLIIGLSFLGIFDKKD